MDARLDREQKQKSSLRRVNSALVLKDSAMSGIPRHGSLFAQSTAEGR
jgi:hypothetical protein